MTTVLLRPEAEATRSLFEQRVGPLGFTNPALKEVYDFIVIGGGPAGMEAAVAAARLGASVALIERNKLGGNSLNAGTVPSQSMIATARAYVALRRAEVYGLTRPTLPPLDFAAVMERMLRVQSEIAALPSLESLARLGVDIFFGKARFISTNTIGVGEAEIAFRKALVATGAQPSPSDIPGLAEIGYHTSETIFAIMDLPKRLVVVGGGPVGCEMAQAFCRLGSQVTIIQDEPKFLPREERDAAEILSRAMARDGVEIRLNTTVTGARQEGNHKILRLRHNEVESEVETDEILLSIGRLANVRGLALEAAGIALDVRKNIGVDAFLQTANPNVYAAGDVCMNLKFTHAARATARMAVRNALAGSRERHDQLTIPWCTYCDPEIAHVGIQVWQARNQSIPIKSYTVMMHDVDRAITDGLEEGFVKLHIADGTDRILGGTIVASRASELINELAVVISAGIGMKQLAATVHTYPAESGAIAMAALAFVDDQRRKTGAGDLIL